MLDTAGAAIYKQNIFRDWVFEEKAPVNVDYYIAIYILISFVSVAVMILKNILTYWGSIRGARVMFDGLLEKIIHAPLRFYDTTPVGRILNRFGKDVSTIDLAIARSASFLVDCTTGIAASTIVITAITPQFLIVAIGVSCIYFLIGVYYLRISRELKRLNSVSRSPIYSHFTESLVGVTTIRAYGVEEQFMKTVYEKIDAFIAPFYFLWMSNRWLYARIEFTGAFVSFFTGIFLIINIKHIDAGMAGISLFYARSFLENIYWFIRQYTQVEMNLNSVERVIEYIEVEQEPPAIIEGSRPPAAWPTTASIEVKDLVIRYAPELDPVLHGVSFTTKPYEKIGIVGRTGSGKSTMALSFFRFLEASSGSISIDGIDISKIGLQDLRTQMTIIPQDAILFSGTIRSNLDPFKEHSDEEIWESLQRAHLVKATDRLKASSSGSSTPNASESVALEEEQHSSPIKSLTQQVSDGGNNFSQGQRQLLCLARALLKNSRLIIMDEATASVDFDTDAKIQTTIREEFVNSTLLCIAHRLRTVIDYDRILVLDQGRVVEFDTPYNLISNDNGVNVFKSMCEKSGEFEVLLNMATEAHNNKTVTDITPDNHSVVY
jgi:ABC-type multidrug transport system fused ATPase/permease subunit